MDQPLVIPDCRCPGRPMVSLPLKVPDEAAAELQRQAERLGCSRTALGRTLLMEALKRLQAES